MSTVLTVGDIVNLQAPILREETSILTAIDKLLDSKLNGAAVCDKNEQLIGFLSTHDIMVEMWCRNNQLQETTTVGELMNTDVMVIDASVRLSDALEYLALDMAQLYPTTDSGYVTNMTTLTVEERAKSIKVSKPQILPVLDKGQYVGLISRHEVLTGIRSLCEGNADITTAGMATVSTA